MGLYSYYQLEAYSIKSDGSLELELEFEFDDLETSSKEDMHAVEIDGSPFGEATWYKHREDMIKYSRKYPSTVFKLHATPYNHDDYWVEYYLNGAYQYCPGTIVYDTFHRGKLVS